MRLLAWLADGTDYLAVAITGRNVDEWLEAWGLQEDIGPLAREAGHR